MEEIWHNTKYVFAMNNRYSWREVEGVKEAVDIVETELRRQATRSFVSRIVPEPIMKPKLILCLALVLCGHIFAQDTTNSYHRISIAEVGSVRLEVEQFSNYENGVQIRVSDFAAQNWKN